MAASVNIKVRCEECTFADWAGRSCSHGLMFPVLVLMTGEPCPNFIPKTKEQIKEQIQILKLNK